MKYTNIQNVVIYKNILLRFWMKTHMLTKAAFILNICFIIISLLLSLCLMWYLLNFQ